MKRHDRIVGGNNEPYSAAAASASSMDQQSMLCSDYNDREHRQRMQHQTRERNTYNSYNHRTPASNRYTHDNDYDEVPQMVGSFQHDNRSHPMNSSSIVYDSVLRWKTMEEHQSMDHVESRNGQSRSQNYGSYSDSQVAIGPSINRIDHYRNSDDDYFYKPTIVPTIRQQNVAIVSPIYDDCFEERLSAKISLRSGSDQWEELKPPPFNNDFSYADDDIYHHDTDLYHYSKQSYEAKEPEPSETVYGHHPNATFARKLPPSYQSPPVTLPGAVQSKMIEICPGSLVRLRGADETYEAVRNDFYIPCQCMICSCSDNDNPFRDDEPLFCIQDADFFLCPNCKSICPLDDGTANGSRNGGGVGLGFTMEMLVQIQDEITSKHGRK
jgi:hypothetical protein